jgi:hypothetical protein
MRKILPRRHQLPGRPGRPDCEKPSFCWIFRTGTAFADPSLWKSKAALCGRSKVRCMMFALGAVSSALDAVKSLTSSGSSSTQPAGLSEIVTDPFDPSGGVPASGGFAPGPGAGGFSQLSPATMSALLAAQSQSTTTASAPTSQSGALQDLFSQIDANGDGQITKSEFENALGAGGTNLAQADDVFGKLDSNGDGSVSLSELSSALKGSEAKGGHHHHAHVSGSSGSGDGAASNPNGTGSTAGASSDPLLQALAGASSTSVANGDGSTTTSLTYADGSKVTTTSPAATATASTAATSSYNLIEQMIQREAQSISFLANPSLSFSA